MQQNDTYSPGQSWYDTTISIPQFEETLKSDLNCDVVVVGGGLTGLSAAYHLAVAGIHVVLLEQGQIGAGASGRNGGQLGTGQRHWAEDMMHQLGEVRGKALFKLAEDAKHHVIHFANHHEFDIDFTPGQISVAHKKGFVRDYEKHVSAMHDLGYKDLSFMDYQETCQRLGSKRYFGGMRDMGTGHINPLKLVVGTARVAHMAGAHIYQNSRVTNIKNNGKKIEVFCDKAQITANHVLIATNAYGDPLNASQHYVAAIRSFIGATVPLDDTTILPGLESVDDSRFVVRYFRKTRDNVLLFGGSEAYGRNTPQNIGASIRDQMIEIYPQLANVEMTHNWGGTVGITRSRLPFVRDIAPNVTYCGGYSGHGVMLSHYFGRLYAESLTGDKDKLYLLRSLKMSSFPGGQFLRQPLLYVAMQWFALLDRL